MLKRICTVILIPALLCSVFNSCKKDERDNPFDDPSLKPPVTNKDVNPIPTDNFAYLHEKVFGPTCANSGCHDGNFEPDFRTVSSSYQSLVYQPVISNDASNSFQYRVLPGNADKSLLYKRLVDFIPNTSGQMPLSVEPGSDWPVKQQTYIQHIKDWINNGAKDLFGNSAATGNLQPQVTGFLAFPFGYTSNPYPRASGTGIQPIEIPTGSKVDLWFAVTDDQTSAQHILVNEMKISTAPFDFNGATVQTLSITNNPLNANGFNGKAAKFSHEITVSLNYPAGTNLYIRVYLNDGSQSKNTEIPNNGTNAQTMAYFHIKIK